MTRVDDDKDTRFTWGEDIVREAQTVTHTQVETEEGQWDMLSEEGSKMAVIVMDSDHTVDPRWP